MSRAIADGEIAKMLVKDALDLSPEVRRYLLARIPDI